MSDVTLIGVDFAKNVFYAHSQMPAANRCSVARNLGHFSVNAQAVSTKLCNLRIVLLSWGNESWQG